MIGSTRAKFREINLKILRILLDLAIAVLAISFVQPSCSAPESSEDDDFDPYQTLSVKPTQELETEKPFSYDTAY